jgi:hypothetical protein
VIIHANLHQASAEAMLSVILRSNTANQKLIGAHLDQVYALLILTATAGRDVTKKQGNAYHYQTDVRTIVIANHGKHATQIQIIVNQRKIFV